MLELTFERSAAQFILDTFPEINPKCEICGKEIDERNLGGVVAVGGEPRTICDNSLCLIEWATSRQE